MGLFSRWRKSSRRTNNIVDEYVIRSLIDKHWLCRSFQKGALRGTALYRGIVYRGDPGWANNRMQYFFDNGFTQQNEQNVDWEKFSGKFAGGHISGVVIATLSLLRPNEFQIDVLSSSTHTWLSTPSVK